MPDRELSDRRRGRHSASFQSDHLESRSGDSPEPVGVNHLPIRIAIFASGAGTTAAEIIRTVESIPNATIALAIGNKSDSGFLNKARNAGLKAVHLSGLTHPDPAELDAAIAKELRDAEIDLVILAGYMKKVGPMVLADNEGRVVNTHPALLPRYGGQRMYGDRVHRAVLANQEAVTGASVHVVTAEYDEGPILAQVQVPVLPDDDVDSLRDRVQAAERSLLSSWLIEYCRRQ